MLLHEKELRISRSKNSTNLLEYVSGQVLERLGPNEIPVRFVITRTNDESYHCELGVLSNLDNYSVPPKKSIFEFEKRNFENVDQFNAVLLVPTGIGAEIGGHSGDAGPVARLLALACDNLITHPNVVNASDINELPENGLYVEGSVITRLLMGTIGLQKVRANRIMLVIDKSGSMSWGGRYDTYSARGIDLDGNYAYIADYSNGIRSFDISVPLVPQYLDRYDTSYAFDVFVDGSEAYLADYYSGIRSIDVSNPNNMSQDDRVDLSGNYSYGITVNGNYAFAGNGSRGVDSYDISNPSNMSQLDRYNTPGYARGIDANGNYVYVADGGSGFRILNASDPNNLSNEDVSILDKFVRTVSEIIAPPDEQGEKKPVIEGSTNDSGNSPSQSHTSGADVNHSASNDVRGDEARAMAGDAVVQGESK